MRLFTCRKAQTFPVTRRFSTMMPSVVKPEVLNLEPYEDVV
jgi:hypothetical protein